MSTKLFINTQARDLTQALVRSASDLSVISFADVVVGDRKGFELYFVDGKGGYDNLSGNALYVPYVAIGNCGYPTSGTWTATFGANTTGPLAYNISPAALQTALEGLASIGAGNVTVIGSAGEWYQVTFVGTKAATDVDEITCNGALLNPAAGVSVDTLQDGDVGVNEVQLLTMALQPLVFQDDWTPITNGWFGRLSMATLELVRQFAEQSDVDGLLSLLQVAVMDPSGYRSTYVRMDARVKCSPLNPGALVGADKPDFVTQAQLAAAVISANGFDYQAANSTVTGNTDITRTTATRHHTAVVTVTGAAGVRTFALQTTNSPLAGDTCLLVFNVPATAGIELQVRNATNVGTLLKTITTNTSGQPHFVQATYTGAAWVPAVSTGDFLTKSGNLAGLASAALSRANLKAPFGTFSASKTANFSVVAGDDGTYFPVNAASGDVLVTLPAANSVPVGFSVIIQKTDAALTEVSTSPATLDLARSGQSLQVVSDGTSWVVPWAYVPVNTTPAVLTYSTLTGLTGGGASNLDGVVTAGGAVATDTLAAVTRMVNNRATFRLWQLVDGTDSETTTVIRPDDYDVGTNPRVWKLCGGANGFLPVTNNSGNTTIIPLPSLTTAVATITGAAGVRILVLTASTDYLAGDLLKLKVELPTTAGITVEIRNATTGGTLLASVLSEATAYNYFFEFVYDGTAWKLLQTVA